MADRPILFSAVNHDFSDPLWSYFLGAIHGDGHISKRSVSISVSYKEPGYLATLSQIATDLGFSPKLYRPRSAYRLDIHSAELARTLRLTKSDGIWSIPADIKIGPYLAGVIDTDGHITKPPQRQVIITLKRSGNLHRLASRLVKAGLRCNPVKERTTSFKGAPYEIEEIRWAGGDQIEWIAEAATLRHPRKANRLAEIAAEAKAIRLNIPLWQEVANWISEGPRDVDEIMEQFDLSKKQVDSIIGNIRANRELQVIPPPRVLTKYSIRNPQ